jgi:serine/threonine protein kinase
MLNTTIAHYKVTAKLGQGGMGEVYRATDTKLGREVAIKVLPEALAGDTGRLARFQREAEMLASLNHPNIAAIHGLEESEGGKALVLELVEGETLSERLKKGPMAVEDALETCLGIAEALEAAHEKGIIHRDLKPANVKFTSDGKVKVLDFGLAKALDSEVGRAYSRAESQAPDGSRGLSPHLEDSPTITADYTMPGTILGTAAYMSPEQARGKGLDKRTDIWSFGCVLFECLTGKKLFQGEDVTETLASIIKGEPEWASLPTNTPPTIQILLRKCLSKNRKRRLQDMGDARVDLEEAISDPSSSFIRLSDQAIQSAGKSRGRPVLVGAVGVLACGVFLALGWFLKPIPVPGPLPMRTLDVKLGEEATISVSRQAFKLSPDGTKLVYSLLPPDAEEPQLFLRHFDQLVSTPIAGTLNASHFCISPDGSSLVFRKSGDHIVYKVPITGGNPHEFFSTINRKASIEWTQEDWIVYGELADGLYRVPSGGGTPEPLTLLAPGERSHQWPHVLPGGQAVLY